MNTRFKNGRVLLLKDEKKREYELIYGDLYVKDDTIQYIGDPKELDGETAALKIDREIDAADCVLIPGFKNAHTHTAMTFGRSLADDRPLQSWLFDAIFPREALLTADDCYWLNILGIMEYVSGGVTSNFDMYFFPPTDAKASVDTGFRTVQTSGLNNFGGSVELLEENYNIVNEMSDLTSFIIGFHAEYTTSLELMEGVAGLAAKYKSPVFLHNSETKKEVMECGQRWGKTPTELTDSLGMYEYGGGGYHCVWLSDEDIKIFKKRGLYVVTNPSSNIKLASGIADVKRILDEGISLAIGTDGPASNNALDMFREMFLASALSKVKYMDAAVVDSSEIFYAATTSGARCMGLENCDRLSVGKKADIAMIDMNRPNMQPEINFVKNLVYAGAKDDVKLTMVNGKVLYEDGRFDIGFDPKEVYARAGAVVERLRNI